MAELSDGTELELDIVVSGIACSLKVFQEKIFVKEVM